MRIVLRVLAVLIGLAGALVGTAGVAAAAYVGSDDTVTLTEQTVKVPGVALSTAPQLIAVYGPTLHLTARSAQRGQPLFVGVTPSFQAADYLRDRRRTVLTAYRWPDASTTSQLDGSATVPAPAPLDIWTAKQQGTGEAVLSWPLANGRYDLVVMRADGSTLGDVSVRAGLELPGLFATTVGVAAGGLGAFLLAAVVVVLTRRRPNREAAA